MVVHPAAWQLQWYPGKWTAVSLSGKAFGNQGVIRPGIVHRIDKDTSGLLRVAKNDLHINH